MDLLVYDPKYLQQRIDWEDWFVREITEKGKCCMKPLTQEWVDKAEGDWACLAVRCGRVKPRTTTRLVFTRSNAPRSISKHGSKKAAIASRGRTTCSNCLGLVLPC